MLEFVCEFVSRVLCFEIQSLNKRNEVGKSVEYIIFKRSLFMILHENEITN